ncbi:Di-sulfide bridge nucleocytoplasmic transport domain-containing protein [Radiomyces spectabilis]|uniref:Di-sulfide bridge nucleocytoplasmic transport domain-containing protein n=1 Tax=Radiomyces spectabilis TaxID=64574 RepID=UPI0022201092|nr:Di-sulfide bridge nucleocytoplasmic transport domain-containing protein [Radiomyces spectabilis]KAI8391806.1 Di-sulfide bridge nucleocytoplasmic transport domain-containing protein [Radiomyces spectabilis]
MHHKRTTEAPMEFEYEHPPVFAYSVFSGSAKCDDDHPYLRKDELAPKSNSFSFFLPKSYLSTEDHTSFRKSYSVFDDLSRITLEDNDQEITNDSNQVDHNQSSNQDTIAPESSLSHETSVMEPETESLDVQTDLLPVVPYQQPCQQPCQQPARSVSDDRSPFSPPQLSLSTQSGSPPNVSPQSPYPSPPFIHVKHDPVAHHRGLIYYLSGLFRMGINLVLFLFALYLAIQFASALKRDVIRKLEIYESDMLDETIHCNKLYAANMCDPSTRRPHMEDQCKTWEQCIHRPMWIGRTKVLAETFAEILNSFVDEISIKTIIVCFSVFFAFMWSSAMRPKETHKQPLRIGNHYDS